MRSGRVYILNDSNTTSRLVDIYGYDWSRLAAELGSVAYDPTTPSTAYDFYFNGAIATGVSVFPSAGPGARWNAFTLRCLRVCPWFGADLWTFVKFLYIPHQVSNYIPSQKYQIVV